ncbi:cytosolic protein [Caldalkalibacillus salinus]|uniref:cytosolic protein n=1 Tax=Caldalkalibacillus salinus TaxID=2803787 RepID=UPI0019222D1B|nr:cytosolic protein [Caldalkalibacillus salinus]
MGIKDFFSNRAETQEIHRDERLQTRYYKANLKKSLDAVDDLLKADARINVLSYSEDHGEITAEFLKPKKAFIVVSCITVFPFRTAVDFTVTTKTTFLPFDAGFSKREVIHFYEKLDQRLTFAGTGLSEKK